MTDVREAGLRSVASAWLAGAVCGGLFLALGGVLGGYELLGTLPVPALAGWVVVRSVALFAWAGGLVGLVVGVPWMVLANRFGRSDRWLVPILLGAGVAVTTVAYLSAWWQLDVLAGLPLSHSERLPAFLRHAGLSVVVGLVTVVLAAWLRARVRLWPRGWTLPLSLLIGVASLLAFLATQLVLGPRRAQASSWRPSQVVVAAVDGVTLRVLAPLLARKELPTFQRLIDEGAWGSILTYGVASSPVVWTSVATGKRARDHRIVDFVTKNPGSYRARPMRSTDWRARPVWSILGDAGREVGVVNWLMTGPPQPVRGAMVTQLDLEAATARTYPSSLQEAVSAVLARRAPKDAAGTELDALKTHVDNVFDTADMLLDALPLDFLALYQSATDGAEHTSWRDYQPSAFDDDLWPPADARRADLIPDIHRHLDARLGALLDRLDDDALLIVVSDHGQLPASAPRLRLDLEALLLRTGWGVPLAADPSRIDRHRSRVYPLVETKWTPSLRVNVNLIGREHDGTVVPEHYRDVVDELARTLAGLRFEDGTPLFARVTQARRPAGEGAAEGSAMADLVLEPTRRGREPSALERTLVLGTEAVPFRELVTLDTAISGDHDRQGVLFVHGKGIRPGPIGQRTVTTAVQRLIWHLTDRVELVDAWLPLLGKLGIVERATTLDITPTVLYAVGLPVARDMAGRPLVELFGGERAPQWVDTYESGRAGRSATDVEDEATEADDEMLERLRALGYVG